MVFATTHYCQLTPEQSGSCYWEQLPQNDASITRYAELAAKVQQYFGLKSLFFRCYTHNN
jgi:hypothetical protein